MLGLLEDKRSMTLWWTTMEEGKGTAVALLQEFEQMGVMEDELARLDAASCPDSLVTMIEMCS